MNIISSIRSLIQPSYCSCCAESLQPLGAGALAPAAFKVGNVGDYYQVGSTTVHHVYSARNAFPGGPVDNNVGMFCALTSPTSALIFGTGYGDVRQGGAGNARSALDDADHCIGALSSSGLLAAATYVVPHGHGDHINPAFVAAMESLGATTTNIHYHSGDKRIVEAMPWTAAQRAALSAVTAKSCWFTPLTFSSDAGAIFKFISRPGHTPGAIDMDVFDLLTDYKILVLGSKDSTRCPRVGYSKIVQAHGNGTL